MNRSIVCISTQSGSVINLSREPIAHWELVVGLLDEFVANISLNHTLFSFTHEVRQLIDKSRFNM
jgi:hypothetical protein